MERPSARTHRHKQRDHAGKNRLGRKGRGKCCGRECDICYNHTKREKLPIWTAESEIRDGFLD